MVTVGEGNNRLRKFNLQTQRILSTTMDEKCHKSLFYHYKNKYNSRICKNPKICLLHGQSEGKEANEDNEVGLTLEMKRLQSPIKT